MLPEEVFRTEVYVHRDPKTKAYRKCQEDTPGRIHYWADWRPLTVGAWKRVKSNLESSLTENCWKKLLVETNLISMPRFETHYIEDQFYRGIMGFWPSFIPHQLLSQYTDQAYINPYRSDQIEYECIRMFSSGGNLTSNEEFPEITQALEAMNLQSRYGVLIAQTMDDLPYRLFLVMKIISRALNVSQDIQRQIQTTTQRAQEIKRTGVIPEDELHLYRNPEERNVESVT